MKCPYCEWRCDLGENVPGKCRMYALKNGEVKELHPFRWSRTQAVYIEQVPIFHFMPGMRLFQIGSFNCNAACKYCINSSVALHPENEAVSFPMSCRQVIRLAKSGGYGGIHLGINELTVNFPSALAIAKQARAEGLYAGCSSNGFFTEAVAAQIADSFDFVNISLKALSDEFYKRKLGLPTCKPTVNNIRFLSRRTHVEVTTPIINDNEKDILPIACLLNDIDEDMAWHVFRAFAENELDATAVPDIDRVTGLVDKARAVHKYIYWGNFVGSKWVDTVCPVCGKTIIKRIVAEVCGATLQESVLTSENCPFCGTVLPITVK